MMNGNYKRKEVAVSSLVIYAENPRHEPAQSEIEAMELLWKVVSPKKMMNLAIDIAKVGLVPNEIPVVVPIEGTKNRYEVYDGNRRLTALRILMNPDKYDFVSARQKKILKEAVANSGLELPETIFVCITDKEKALFLINKIHTGEDEGRGRTQWNAEAIRRFEIKNGTSKDEVDYILEKAAEDFDRSDLTNRVPITTIKRLFYKPIKEAIGINKNHPESFTKDRILLAIKIIDAAADKAENGAILSRWNQKQACDILLPIINEYTSNHPLSPIPYSNLKKDKSFQNPPEFEASEPSGNSRDKDNSGDNQSQPKKLRTIKKTEPYFFTGLNLAPLNSEIQNHHAVITLGDELIRFSKDKTVGSYPNAAAYLTRAFIEAVFTLNLKSTLNSDGKDYFSILKASKKGRYGLKEIIDYHKQNKEELIPRDQFRVFEAWLTNTSKLIEPINLTMHQAEKYRISASKLISMPSEGLLDLINTIIKNSSGQN